MLMVTNLLKYRQKTVEFHQLVKEHTMYASSTQLINICKTVDKQTKYGQLLAKKLVGDHDKIEMCCVGYLI